MDEEKLDKLLNELTERTAEPVRPGLAEDIKQCIPERLIPYRKGIDSINIIVDLRVSKSAAAAVIIITMILLASFFGGRNSTGNGLGIQDGKLLADYLLGGTDRNNISTAKARYEYLVQQGKDVVFYESTDPEDHNSVWMHWKLPDGKYGVVFGDLSEREVSAEELIELQARMLQKKRK